MFCKYNNSMYCPFPPDDVIDFSDENPDDLSFDFRVWNKIAEENYERQEIRSFVDIDEERNKELIENG